MGRRRRGRLRQFYRRLMEYKQFRGKQKIRMARHTCPVCEAKEMVKLDVVRRPDGTYLVTFHCANCGASDRFILTQKLEEIEIYHIVVDRLLGEEPPYKELIREVEEAEVAKSEAAAEEEKAEERPRRRAYARKLTPEEEALLESELPPEE